MAFQEDTGILYSSAFLKRNTGFGPEGMDAIYLVEYPSFEAFYDTVAGEEVGARVLRLRNDTLANAKLIITWPPGIGED